MTITPEELAVLEAAANDREYVTLKVGLPGGREMPVSFASTITSTNSLRTMRVLVGASPDTPEGQVQRTLDVLDFMRALAVDEHNRALLDKLDEMGFLDSASLMSMMNTLIGMVSGRPTTKPSSSADGPSPDGPPSTATADSTGSTQLPSPSIAS